MTTASIRCLRALLFACLWLVAGGQYLSAAQNVAADDLIGRDGEATVDGTHPTDLGFMRIADALEPVLRQALLSRNAARP